MRLGEIIKKYRRDCNISIRDFARRCELSGTYIDKLEKNVCHSAKAIEPTLYAFGKIASAMNLSMTELMFFMENDKNVEVSFEFNESRAKLIVKEEDGNILKELYGNVLPVHSYKLRYGNSLYEVTDIITDISEGNSYVEIIVKKIAKLPKDK